MSDTRETALVDQLRTQAKLLTMGELGVLTQIDVVANALYAAAAALAASPAPTLALTRAQMTELGKRVREACSADMGPCLPGKPLEYWCDACLALAALTAEGEPPAALVAEAHGYLARLLTHHAPQCEPLPDLLGLCSQIDNLLTGQPVALLREWQAAYIQSRTALATASDIGHEVTLRLRLLRWTPGEAEPAAPQEGK